MRPDKRLPFALSLAAVIFGGALLGLGNALWDSVASADDSDAHHHQEAASTAVTLPRILTLPAHCLFCIDGVTPQPTELSRAVFLSRSTASVIPPCQSTRAPQTAFATAYKVRAPPVLS